MALFRQDLDAGGCSTPDCGHDHSVLYLVGACHPDGGTDISYEKRTGFLTVRCSACKKLVAEIAVSREVN